MAQMHLNEGIVLDGRYRLDRQLGMGGFGITYKATDLRLDRPVAVKEYFPNYCAARLPEWEGEVRPLDGMGRHFVKGMDRFSDEARRLAQLSHLPSVVHVNDYFEANGTAYMVMDFVEGQTLKQMVDKFGGRIRPEMLMSLIGPAVSTLWHVHKKGLIHRDLSPDNIMIRSDNSVCLIDFGNARSTDGDKSMTVAMKQGFAAPEQYSTRGQDTYTDVYGLCATLYYCLTGRLPTRAVDRLAGKPLPWPREMGVVMDRVQEQAIMDGLELQTNLRIRNMEALYRRLFGQK
ncbi:MAG: serine/threonine protein kinase [Ruminococcaceae bacterium]|nr:serine/threonine protein kinase [Oscillospiraceae bacterium]